jgi:hypothetical protein
MRKGNSQAPQSTAIAENHGVIILVIAHIEFTYFVVPCERKDSANHTLSFHMQRRVCNVPKMFLNVTRCSRGARVLISKNDNISTEGNRRMTNLKQSGRGTVCSLFLPLSSSRHLTGTEATKFIFWMTFPSALRSGRFVPGINYMAMLRNDPRWSRT